jgi:hypothetical protein
MALASLVPFQGPKKSRFSGPTPSNACNDVAPLKTIMYRAIKTTGTLIVIFPPPSLLWDPGPGMDKNLDTGSGIDIPDPQRC